MDILRLALSHHLAFMDPYGLIAELLDLIQGMRDDNDSSAVISDLLELVEALRLEVCIAYSQDLIDKKDIGIYVDGYGEREPHVHTG